MSKQKKEFTDLHFSTKPLLGLIAALAVLAAALLLLAPQSAPDAPPPGQAAAQQDETLRQDAEMMQKLTYARCGHVVEKRVTLPRELHGATRERAQALYPDWQLTEFGASKLAMERALELYCPAHKVLLPDGMGMLCIFENKYGDAYARVDETGVELRGLPAALQEEVRLGLGFDDLHELESWLESAES